MFIAKKGYSIIGGDIAGVENRIASHYAYKFDNGVYAELITNGDAHTVFAEQYSKAANQVISRGEGKNITYAILYGASAGKISTMLSVDMATSQRVIDAFWDVNVGLKGVRDSSVKYWESTGKKYIMGLDGRKIFIRSAHSCMNALFQSAGSIVFETACCFTYNMIRSEGLDANTILRIHDESQIETNNNLISSHICSIDTPMEHDGKIFTKPNALLDGSYYQMYSRVGEIMMESFKKAGEYYNLLVPITGDYMVSEKWGGTH